MRKGLYLKAIGFKFRVSIHFLDINSDGYIDLEEINNLCMQWGRKFPALIEVFCSHFAILFYYALTIHGYRCCFYWLIDYRLTPEHVISLSNLILTKMVD